MVENLKIFSRISQNNKITAVKNALEQALLALGDLVTDLEELDVESKSCQTQLLTQIQLCNSKTCQSANELKKIIDTKDNIIQSVASSLTKLYETRSFETISEIFKIICGDVNTLTPPKEEVNNKTINGCSTLKKEKILEFEQDQSVSEIENTPTGRKSPIIQSKITKSIFTTPLKREKKKCPDNWPTPDSKIVLTYPTPSKGKTGGKLRQTKFNLSRFKQSSVVDLTSSPELKVEKDHIEKDLMCNVKKEVVDDETILPSPTSGPINFQLCNKSSKENMPIFKIPATSAKIKGEVVEESTSKGTKSPAKSNNISQLLEQSIRYTTPVKNSTHVVSPATSDESLSLLQHVKMLEEKENNPHDKRLSPSKRPLGENVNVMNVSQQDIDSSMSILRTNPLPAGSKPNSTAVLSVNKKMKSDLKEPIYKEPTVRKKADKKALPGWSCHECYIFYDELYKNDPEMLAKKMEECSKHRGRNNPVRPATPGGFWNPRWDVPEDTEEFNRRNNAI